MEATHRAVWETLKRDLFQPEVLLYAVEKAIANADETDAGDKGQEAALPRTTPDGRARTRAPLDRRRRRRGRVAALLASMQERERRRAHLHEALHATTTAQHLGRLDRELRIKIAEWTRLLDALGGERRPGAALLRKLMRGKLAFAPDLEARRLRLHRTK